MLKDISRDFFFSSIRAENTFQNLKNGDIVKAKILNLNEEGSARIFFNGKIFEGNILGSIKEGSVLTMRVLITENKIFLIPESENSMQKLNQNENFFSQLGLPKGELSTALLSFLMTSESRLDSKKISQLFDFLKNIKKNKKKSVFVAGLLENKGISLDEKNFKKIYPLIFGEEFDVESNEDNLAKNTILESLLNTKDKNNLKDNTDILEFINHFNKKKLHWIVLPFDKNLNDTQAKGSISLLLDIKLKTCRKLMMHCKFGEEKWLFSLKDKKLNFMQENRSLSKKTKKIIENTLLFYMQENGLTNISVSYNNEVEEYSTNSIDISV